MSRLRFAFVVLVEVLLSTSRGTARTLDGGKLDVEVVRGRPPLVGPQSLPLIQGDLESDLIPGPNDIQGGLEDKGGSGGAVLATTEHTPTIPEFNDIEALSKAIEDEIEVEENIEGLIEAAEAVIDEEEEEMEDEYEENFDADIFQREADLVVVMRRMYEAITKRLTLLKSRVSIVEQTAGDILTRLSVLDCSDLKARGQTKSGVYTFHMDHYGKRPVNVACDMETDGGGWTILQRRLPFSKTVSFSRGWHDYKVGFGNASSDYWVGLENMFIWTNTRHYEIRFDLTDFDGDSAYAHYDSFYIEGESQGYRIHISGYSGTAGDSMTNEGKLDNFTADGMMFTTEDEDHDTSHEINCSKYWKIGGWWFNRCSWANLNGPYKEPDEGDGIGINWHMWRNKNYLRSSTIMIRPSANP